MDGDDDASAVAVPLDNDNDDDESSVAAIGDFDCSLVLLDFFFVAEAVVDDGVGGVDTELAVALLPVDDLVLDDRVDRCDRNIHLSKCGANRELAIVC